MSDSPTTPCRKGIRGLPILALPAGKYYPFIQKKTDFNLLPTDMSISAVSHLLSKDIFFHVAVIIFKIGITVFIHIDIEIDR